jgi:hypothetical protein
LNMSVLLGRLDNGAIIKQAAASHGRGLLGQDLF